MSITQVSEQLHFAEVTTFARFFTRMKGIYLPFQSEGQDVIAKRLVFCHVVE